MAKNTNNTQMEMGESAETEILERLSARVEKAVSMIQELRRERDQLRARVEELEAKVADSDETSTRLETLEEEYDRYRKERGEIRDRIETILSNLEELEGAE